MQWKLPNAKAVLPFGYIEEVHHQAFPSINSIIRKVKRKRISGTNSNLFFTSLNNEDGSISGGVNGYQTPDQFSRMLEQHLRDRLTDLLQSFDKNKQQDLESAENEQHQEAPVDQEDVNASPLLWKDSPFPGLQAFDENQSIIYFGRGRETDQLLAVLSNPEQRFVAVVGASGSGKSSLVAAGLIPRLKDGALPGSAQWCYLRFTPAERGNNPFMALAHVVKQQIADDGMRVKDLAQTLTADPDGLSGKLPELLAGRPENAELILFIDQFEELFSASVEDQYREPFIAFLKQSAVMPKVRIVATIRADFYHRALDFEILAELFRGSGTFSLAAPGAGALDEMIERPAKVAGLELQEGLVDKVLEDTGTKPGVLPLMAFALSELYLESAGSRSLTLPHYKTIGGVKGAIARRAEQALTGRGGEINTLLDKIFPELVNFDKQGVATRRRALLEPINKGLGASELIDHLCDARLFVTDQDDTQQATLEIAHEALLQSWPRLSDWIKEHRDALTARDDLEAAAKAWERAGSSRWSGLPSGNLFKRYVNAASIPDSAKDFLKACRFYQRLRMTGIGLFAALLFVFVADMQFDRWRDNEKLTTRAALWVLLTKTGLYFPAVPEMVEIPPAEVWKDKTKRTLIMSWLDSDKGADDAPPTVTFDKPFRMGKYEVTFDEYQVFAYFIEEDGGCQDKHEIETPSSQDAGWGRGRRPVINVSWEDAVCYAEWLTMKTKSAKSYRLPTEAEWEYAARAGTKTAYWWGDGLEKQKAVCNNCDSDWEGKDKGSRTAKVDDPSFQPNPWGLFHTAGNVWEWCADWYHVDPMQAVTDPVEGVRRVLRGGSWRSNGGIARSAYRDEYDPSDRHFTIGFRLALGQAGVSAEQEQGDGRAAAGRTAVAEPGSQAGHSAPVDKQTR